jgi:hypothetical protein
MWNSELFSKLGVDSWTWNRHEESNLLTISFFDTTAKMIWNTDTFFLLFWTRFDGRLLFWRCDFAAVYMPSCTFLCLIVHPLHSSHGQHTWFFYNDFFSIRPVDCWLEVIWRIKKWNADSRHYWKILLNNMMLQVKTSFERISTNIERQD